MMFSQTETKKKSRREKNIPMSVFEKARRTENETCHLVSTPFHLKKKHFSVSLLSHQGEKIAEGISYQEASQSTSHI